MSETIQAVSKHNNSSVLIIAVIFTALAAVIVAGFLSIKFMGFSKLQSLFWGENSVMEIPAAGGDICNPIQLANENSWLIMGWADEGNWGILVEVFDPVPLPRGWEAIGDGKNIQTSSEERTVSNGVWSIYPPLKCRQGTLPEITDHTSNP